MTLFATAEAIDYPAWISATAAAIGVLVALVGLIFGLRQLNGLSTSLKLNALAVLLNLEVEIHTRKSKVDELSSQMLQLGVRETQDNKKKILVLRKQLDGEIESYLNAIDRLAY